MFRGKLFGILMVEVLVALFGIACGGNGSGEFLPATETPVVSPVVSPSPDQTATPISEPTVTPSPTPVVTPSPTSTLTPESPSANPVPGSCGVFEEKYCAIGEIVDWQGNRFLAFRLPANAAIFAPFDGIVSTPTFLPTPEAKAVSVYQDTDGDGISEPEDGMFIIAGDIIQAPGIEKVKRVKQGEVIAVAVEHGIKVFGDYSAVLYFTRYNPETKRGEIDPILFREFFPYY